jgi:hypothetical protein
MHSSSDDLRLTPDEAAQALAAIETSRDAMRSAIRAYRGHCHLWLWGFIWIAMAMLAEFLGHAGIRLFPWIALAGVAGSFGLGWFQSGKIRAQVDKRFLGVLGAVILFAAICPAILRPSPSNEAVFAYIGLVAMLCYVIAGIWFDTYLLWLGSGMGVLILLGLFLLPGIFWWWIAIFGGGPLIAAGFYVRFCWR